METASTCLLGANTWARARILDTVANLATHFQKL